MAQRYVIRLKAPKSYDRFVWSDDDAYDIFCSTALKFNKNHVPAGSPQGGQFASADGTAGDNVDHGEKPSGPGALIKVTDRLGNEAEIDDRSSLYRWIVKRPDGTWGLDPQRELVHQQIINELLDGAKRQDGPVTMYMTGGGPAAGKSTAMADLLPKDALLVDPDKIKTMLPEYNTLQKAGNKELGSILHEESSMIRKRLEQAAIAGNYNVIVDTTGDSSVDKLQTNLAAYRKAGYKINAYYATNDPDIAMERANARGAKTGRYVPENFLREAHANVSVTVPKAIEKGLYDHFELYNTDASKARLIATAEGKELAIKDPALWNQFVAKGNSPYATAKAGQESPGKIDTDDLQRMLVSIVLGRTKPSDLGHIESQMWDKLAADVDKCPDGQFVDVGNEISQIDLTNLYSGPLADKSEAKKYSTTAGALDKSIQWVPIKKTDGEKQIVYGEVYAPYVLDTYGEFMTPEDIETMAHRFMQLDLSNVIDTQHDNKPNGSFPVESFIARDNDPDYTPGSWVLGVHIPDPQLWSAVKSGLLNGFSFQSLVKPTSVDVEIDAIRDFVGETELSEDHNHTFFVELDEIGNVVGGRTSKASDGHYHDIKWASVTDRVSGHSHRFFL